MPIKSREFYIDKIEVLDVATLAEAVRYYYEPPLFKELQDTGLFDKHKQVQVRKLVKDNEPEDNLYKSLGENLTQLKQFKEKYPNSIWDDEVTERIESLQKIADEEQEKSVREIVENPNNFTPDEIISKCDNDTLAKLCDRINLDVDLVRNYTAFKDLEFVDLLPEVQEDVPLGYTDVFFWGLPSSGKTCALAALMYTMNKKYAFADAEIPVNFGTAYRNSLVNVFNNEVAYLPPANPIDKTQYMPFDLSYRNDNKGFRKISFFELSGELIKYIYDLHNGTKHIGGERLRQVERAWKSLNIVLRSPNKKIHVFFIDYEKSDRNEKITQEQYLSSAANYFNNKLDIFKEQTDGIYVVM